MKADIKELIAKVLPLIEGMAKGKEKRMEHRMEAPKAPAPMVKDAKDVAQDKVIVMLLDGEEPSEDDEEDEHTSSRSNKYGC